MVFHKFSRTHNIFFFLFLKQNHLPHTHFSKKNSKHLHKHKHQAKIQVHDQEKFCIQNPNKKILINVHPSMENKNTNFRHAILTLIKTSMEQKPIKTKFYEKSLKNTIHKTLASKSLIQQKKEGLLPQEEMICNMPI
jgi:hypothetical protein